ncbi:hypothetical protein COOONC_02969 [Cooperia oncophora]
MPMSINFYCFLAFVEDFEHFQANESGTDEEVSGAEAAATVEESGYSGGKAVVDWSVSNNKVDEFPNGYDGLAALPTLQTSSTSNSVLTNQITEDPVGFVSTATQRITSPTTPVVTTTTPAPSTETHEGCSGLPDSAPPEGSAAQNPSSSVPSAPRVIPYPLPKSIDGAVTGHADKICPPCALLASSSPPTPTVAALALAPAPEGRSVPTPDSGPTPAVSAPVPAQPEPSSPEAAVEVAPAAMFTSDKNESSQEQSQSREVAPSPAPSGESAPPPAPEPSPVLPASIPAQPEPSPPEAVIATSDNNEHSQELTSAHVPAPAPAPLEVVPPAPLPNPAPISEPSSGALHEIDNHS